MIVPVTGNMLERIRRHEGAHRSKHCLRLRPYDMMGNAVSSQSLLERSPWALFRSGQFHEQGDALHFNAFVAGNATLYQELTPGIGLFRGGIGHRLYPTWGGWS